MLNSFDDENDYFADDSQSSSDTDRVIKDSSRSIACQPSRLSNLQRRMLAEELGGITPMQILMSIARDECAGMNTRIEACKVLMPYVHKKMPVAVETIGAATNVLSINMDDIKNISDDEIEHTLEVLEKLGVKSVIDAEARRID
jgi:hypothetical protein